MVRDDSAYYGVRRGGPGFFLFARDMISRPLLFAAAVLLLAVVETVCDRINALVEQR